MNSSSEIDTHDVRFRYVYGLISINGKKDGEYFFEYNKNINDIFKKVKIFEDRRDYRNAIDYILEAANKGHAESQRYIAILYYNSYKRLYEFRLEHDPVRYNIPASHKYDEVVEYYNSDVEAKQFIENYKSFLDNYDNIIYVIEKINLRDAFFYQRNYFTYDEDYFWILISQKNGFSKATDDISFIKKCTYREPFKPFPSLSDTIIEQEVE